VLDLPTVVPTQCLPSGVNVTAVLEASVAIDTGAFDILGGGGGLEGGGSYVLDLPTVVPTQCLPSGVNVTAVLEASVAIDTGVC
jgi:hypothetical protein